MQILETQEFIRNRWYAAALSRSIDGTPSQTRVLGDPVVLFRKQSNEVTALQDRCPHRQAPLSLGKIVGDEIQCRYHGFQFDSTGRCTKIPGEKVIPREVSVPALPVAESLGFVWVWPGDPARADPGLLPSFPWLDNPDFLSYHVAMQFEAPFALIVDNLMDLTHVHFVHSILGADTLVHESEPMRTWEEGDHVLYRRDLKKESAASAEGDAYVEIGGEFIPPSIVITSAVPKRAGSDEIQPAPMSQVLHCLTPRTPDSTSYLVVKCWNILTRPHEIAAVHHQVHVTLLEDKGIIEAQYMNRREAAAESADRLIRADRAAVMARRVNERILRIEHENRDNRARQVPATETTERLMP
jgi:phenylpropionate dioxygenase-like ring-hydroxylating dioxygenase large terminal subunit